MSQPRPKGDGCSIWFWLTDYWWFGHARVLAGIPWNAGFDQGIGPFAISVRWNRPHVA